MEEETHVVYRRISLSEDGFNRLKWLQRHWGLRCNGLVIDRLLKEYTAPFNLRPVTNRQGFTRLVSPEDSRRFQMMDLPGALGWVLAGKKG